MKEDLIKQLKELPVDIESKENEILIRKNDLEELKTSISYYELQINSKVEEEAENNKDLSNSTKRKAEVNRRLANSETYKQLKETLKDKSITFDVLKLRLDRLKREFRGAESLSRLGL